MHYQIVKKHMKKIDFIIIGAQRCGTTSLFKNLISHYLITGPTHKEIHYFDINFSKGIDWYFKQFPSISKNFDEKQKPIIGESSPYYIFHPLAAKRTSEVFPDVKLIVLLRNPVDRAYSHYNHAIRQGNETLSFEEAIKAEPQRLMGQEKIIIDGGYSPIHRRLSYLSRGIYVDQLKVWRRFFTKDQFLILKSEDFYENHKSTLNQVFQFLNLPAFEIKDFKKYQSFNYPDMKEETRKFLIDFFKPHNERLYEYLGRDFQW